MESLNSRIKKIINEAVELRNKYEINGALDYIAIYTKTSEEFDFYSEEVNKIGTIHSENESEVTFILNEEFESIDGNFKLLKVSKPEKERDKIGYIYYVVEDYSDFKDKVESIENIRVMQAEDGVEIIELADTDFEVKIYIPSIALGTEIFGSSQGKQEQTGSDLNWEAELEAEKHRRLQLMADFQNYQKRIEAEKATWGAIANIGLVRELLEVYDDLDLAQNDENINIETAKQAMKSAQDKLVAASKQAGIEKIDVKVGDAFDKEKMEAVSVIQAGDDQKGKVIAVISSAYKYTNKDGILKPAKVVVGK